MVTERHHSQPVAPMAPTRTTQNVLLELVGPVLGEEVVAVQHFLPGGRWGHPSAHLLRRLTGRARLDDRLPTVAVLAVGATRVAVYGAEFSREAGMQLREPLGVWPREQVTGTVRAVTISTLTATSFDTPGSTDDLDVRRASIETPDGSLVADLPGHERPSQRVCTALGLTRGAGPWRRFADRLRLP